MQGFACERCASTIRFDTIRCPHCAAPQGYVPGRQTLRALTGADDGVSFTTIGDATMLWRCLNAAWGCNWVLPAATGATWCLSCSLTRGRPDEARPDAIGAWAVAEAAKRRLVHQLLRLGLPVEGRSPATPNGLTFDLVYLPGEGGLTGHLDGVYADLAEADERHREELRRLLAEPFRTVIGTLRHEVGHHYARAAGQGDDLVEALALFGDERSDYAGASSATTRPVDRAWDPARLVHGPRRRTRSRTGPDVSPTLHIVDHDQDRSVRRAQRQHRARRRRRGSRDGRVSVSCCTVAPAGRGHRRRRRGRRLHRLSRPSDRASRRQLRFVHLGAWPSAPVAELLRRRCSAGVTSAERRRRDCVPEDAGDDSPRRHDHPLYRAHVGARALPVTAARNRFGWSVISRNSGGSCTAASVDRPCSPRCRSSRSSPSPRVAAATMTTPHDSHATAPRPSRHDRRRRDGAPRPSRARPTGVHRRREGSATTEADRTPRSPSPVPARTTSRTRASPSRAARSCTASRPTRPTPGRRTAPASRRAAWSRSRRSVGLAVPGHRRGRDRPAARRVGRDQRRLHRVDAAHPRGHHVPRRHAARRCRGQVQHRRQPGRAAHRRQRWRRSTP